MTPARTTPRGRGRAGRVAGQTESAGKPDAGRLLQRTILPRSGDPLDVRALYLEEDKSNRRRARALSRTSLRIPAQSEISFATYFNAFPASYWRRWTVLDSIELKLSVEGNCRVDVYRSKADGTQAHVCGELVEAVAAVRDVVFALELAPFEDGGWYWFDVTSEDDDVVLHSASWLAPIVAPSRGSVAISITTFNRPADCVAALREVSDDPLVLDVIEAIFVADQGNRKVSVEPGFDAVNASLGGRLRICEQPNLGGSGGFARGMYEALGTTSCEAILFMDDDVVVEPDSILRAVSFSRFAERPTLVGGQMLNLQARSQLHSMGEVVEPYRFIWRPAPHVREGHDFAEKPLRASKLLHRRIDVDYNGWWMCLIPRVVAEQLGMPLPLFIKWDDAEYGLRAGAAGYPTVTMPGVAIWHMPWTDKDDNTDWQAYFHVRNRLVAAALHSKFPRSGGLIKHLLQMTLTHLLALEYSTVALRELAIRDFNAGPSALFEKLPTALAAARKLRTEYDDGKLLPSSWQLPLPSMDPIALESLRRPPTNALASARASVAAIAHNLRPVKPQHKECPQLNLGARDALWFVMARLDSATVAAADGSGSTFRRRDRKLFWSMLGRTLLSHARLLYRFPKLAAEYRERRDTLTGPANWKHLFDG